MVKYIKSYMSDKWNLIFKGFNGYYVLLYNTIDIQGGQNVSDFYIIVEYNIFKDQDAAMRFVDEMNLSEQKRSHNIKCRKVYNEYKNVCDDLWNIGKNSNLNNEEILDVIESLHKCITLRKEHYQDCLRTGKDGHIGAIQKMKSLNRFYIDLLISRLNKYKNI
jgi:hypothetical protein